MRVDIETQSAQADMKAMLIKQYKDLGRPKYIRKEYNVPYKIDYFCRWSEFTVGIVFACLIILWVTKDFSSTPGWEVIFHHGYISDGTVAILCGILPLILPNANPLNSKINWRTENMFFVSLN